MDRTKEILEEYRSRPTNSKFILVNQENRGVSVARNNGFEKASGEFIIFLDADDVVSPEMIFKNTALLSKNSHVAGVGSISMDLLSDGSIGKRRQSVISIEDLLSSSEHKTTCPSGYVWRKKIFEHWEHIFNPVLNSSADKEFLFRIFLSGRQVILNRECSYLYRVNENSMSHRITPILIQDKINYAKAINSKLKIAQIESRKNYISSQYYAISGMCFQIKNLEGSVHYAILSIFYSPKEFIQKKF